MRDIACVRLCDLHHQGWLVDAILAQNSAYEIVTMRSSIWRRSQMSIIVSFDTPSAEWGTYVFWY